MNKKQTLIISTLLLVVVLCGYAATKVNSPLYVNDNEVIGEKTALKNNKTSLKNEKTKSTSSTSYFTEAKLSREQSRNKATQSLKSLLDNENTPKEQKQQAAEEYKTLALRGDKETNIELALKSQGFEDAVCELGDKKANIVLKNQKELSDQQLRQIKDIVISKANIKDVQIKVIE
ncbi:SpoIIIAH-like family protein [Clostridium ihumii]|uniref:SpoIIIAH-like family protein n=1 Tax=Clostridium ihumii TaxID=1470356 RepID=UPI00058E06F9|nr:SpoIIIAH-like family protein [Clostridium ihumii]